MTDRLQLISEQELKLHNSKRDLWISIHGEVYDLSNFIDTHPGGSSILLDFAGCDGTYMFEQVGHSEEARKLMLKYCIGHVKDEKQ